MNSSVQDAPDVRLRFSPAADAPARARRAVGRFLSDPHDPIRDQVCLAVSEMVTNVVTHTEQAGELRMWDPKPDVPLRVEVEDHDPRLPKPVDPSTRSMGGHGLLILDRLADHWGSFRSGVGKVVWAEFDRARTTSSLELGEP
jgi:anti-sigma regulatory factor (Ser/Thr protein kinase)